MSDTQKPSICKYVAVRDGHPCVDESKTPFGFCKKHSKTVQAKRAKEAWEKSQGQEKEVQEKEPPPKISSEHQGKKETPPLLQTLKQSTSEKKANGYVDDKKAKKDEEEKSEA